MKPTINKVSASLAVAVAGLFAGVAQAAIPAVSASFYISGASAARAIPPAIATELCDPAVNDRADYIDNAASINYRINVCTLKNTAEVPTSIRGLKVAFFSRSQGGTLFGIRGVAIPQAIKFIDGSTCPADDGNPATQQICATLTADADYTVPDGAGDGHVPDFGLSDEEPIFGCEVAKENGPAQCTAAEVAALKTPKVTAAPVYQLPWTIQVSTQLATELGGNISSVVLSGIFAGNYQSVADIKSAMGVAPLAGDDTEGLKVCRRTNTSGTQAGHAHIWLGSNFCGANTKIASFVDEAFDDNNVANGWPVNYDIEHWVAAIGRQDVRRMPLPSGEVQDSLSQFSPPVRFGKHYRRELKAARHVRVFLHANVTDIETDVDGRAVEQRAERQVESHALANAEGEAVAVVA